MRTFLFSKFTSLHITFLVEDMDGGAEGFFGIDDPRFLSQRFEQELEGYGIS